LFANITGTFLCFVTPSFEKSGASRRETAGTASETRRANQQPHGRSFDPVLGNIGPWNLTKQDREGRPRQPGFAEHLGGWQNPEVNGGLLSSSYGTSTLASDFGSGDAIGSPPAAVDE